MARTSGKPGEPLEEYLLYVRVPERYDNDLKKTNDFLVRLAYLLSDDDANIYVEPYLKGGEPKKQPRGRHGEEKGIKTSGEDCHGNSPAGTGTNALRPMYFCHNKF